VQPEPFFEGHVVLDLRERAVDLDLGIERDVRVVAEELKDSRRGLAEAPAVDGTRGVVTEEVAALVLLVLVEQGRCEVFRHPAGDEGLLQSVVLRGRHVCSPQSAVIRSMSSLNGVSNLPLCTRTALSLPAPTACVPGIASR